MQILDRYIQRTLLGTTALVVFLFLALQSFFAFIEQLKDIGNGYYGLWQAFQYVALELLGQFYGLFPMVGLIGVLLGLSLLSSQNELTVMRVSGVSLGQVAKIVLKFVFVVTLGMTLLGEIGAPFLRKIADREKAIAMSGGQALSTQHGLWLKEGNNFIHIHPVLSDDRLEGVARFQFDAQQHLVQASVAQHAFYQNNHWELRNIAQSQFSNHRVISQKIPSTTWNLALHPHLLKIAALEPRDMNLKQLYQAMIYRRHNGLREAAYALSFWKRLCQPFATTLMMLLAIPFIFGPLRSATLGLRLLGGICVGFTFYLLNEFFGPLSVVLQFPPLLAAMLPTLLFAGVGYFLLHQERVL